MSNSSQGNGPESPSDEPKSDKEIAIYDLARLIGRLIAQARWESAKQALNDRPAPGEPKPPGEGS